MASVIGNRNSNQDCLLVDDKVYSEEDCIFRYYEINNEKPQIYSLPQGNRHHSRGVRTLVPRVEWCV